MADQQYIRASIRWVVQCKDCPHRGRLNECPMRRIESSETGTRVVDLTRDDGYCDRGAEKT